MAGYASRNSSINDANPSSKRKKEMKPREGRKMRLLYQQVTIYDCDINFNKMKHFHLHSCAGDMHASMTVTLCICDCVCLCVHRNE